MPHKHNIHNYNRSFAIGIALNVIFVVVEAGYGFVADSLALIADSGHNLSDVITLLLAWGASRLATKLDRKSTRLNSSHIPLSRMPSSA